MASIAKNSFGVRLKVGDGATPTEVFTVIPEIMDTNAPDVKADLNDVTSHDSSGGFREYLPGLKDGETITSPFNWRPSDTVHISLRVDAYATTRRNFKQVWPDTGSSTCSFGGYITGLAPTGKMGEPMKGTLSIKVTGEPTWGAT